MFNENYRIIEINENGDISFHYGHKHDERPTSPYRFALKLVKKSDQITLQLPGFFTVDNQFIESTINFEYFELLEIANHDKSYDPFVQISFRLFNKTFDGHREFKIKITGQISYFRPEMLIKVLNEYVKSGLPLDLIKDEQIERHYKLIEGEDAIHIFSDLVVKLFSNSLNRVGKDTVFWEEAELYRLPRDKYLLEILISVLKKRFTVETLDDHLLLTFNRDYGWIASWSRKPETESEEFRKLLYQSIFDFTKSYDKHKRFQTNVQ